MEGITSRALLDGATAIEQWLTVMEQHRFPKMPEVELELSARIRGVAMLREQLITEAHERHTWMDPSYRDCPICENEMQSHEQVAWGM